MPWVETVETKIGYGRTCAWSKHPAQVVDEIFTNVQKAVGRRDSMQCFRFETPIRFEIVFKSWLGAFKARARRRGWHLRGFREIGVKLDSMKDWRC